MRLELNCPNCSWHIVCDKNEMLRWLHSIGMLRREEKPSESIVIELFRKSAGKFSCRDCESTGLRTDIPREDEEDWGQARVCSVCRKIILAERLEIFPDSTTCAACKDQEENPADHMIPEFCPKCGDIMTMKTTGGSGTTQYRLKCPSCR